MKRGDLIEIVWSDSISSSKAWMSEEEAKEWIDDDVELRTVGFFFFRSRKSITVYQSCHGDRVGGVWQIPIGCVRNIRRLRRLR